MAMEIVFAGGQKVDALYKGFRIQTDQPKYAGGKGSAPAPFDLFLASLGTCAGIYVLSFCQERDISADKIKLILNTEKDRESKMIRRIDIEIQLPAAFPIKYKKAIVKAAELCTVTRHLYYPPKFDVHAEITEEEK